MWDTRNISFFEAYCQLRFLVIAIQRDRPAFLAFMHIMVRECG